MRNYKNSSYAANKYSKNIVYNSEVSGITAITLEDFLKSDPTLTEADFKFWKQWSDNDYEAESKDTNRITKNNLSVTNLDEALSSCNLSLEESYEKEFEDTLVKTCVRYALEKFFTDSKVTEVMRERFTLYYFKGMKYEHIAKKVGGTRQGVTKSIKAAFSIFKRYFIERYLEMGGLEKICREMTGDTDRKRNLKIC